MESHWGWNVSWHFSAFIEQLKIFPAVWSSKLYDLPLASLQTRALCWDGTFSACLVALTLVPPSAVGAAFQPSSRCCFLYSLPVPPKAQLSHRISVWPGDPFPVLALCGRAVCAQWLPFCLGCPLSFPPPLSRPGPLQGSTSHHVPCCLPLAFLFSQN